MQNTTILKCLYKTFESLTFNKLSFESKPLVGIVELSNQRNTMFKKALFALLVGVMVGNAVAMQGGSSSSSSSDVQSTDFVITTPSGSCPSK